MRTFLRFKTAIAAQKIFDSLVLEGWKDLKVYEDTYDEWILEGREPTREEKIIDKNEKRKYRVL